MYHLTTIARHDAPEPDLCLLTTTNGNLTGQFRSFILNAEIELAPSTAKDYSYKLRAFIGYCLDAGIKEITEVTADTARGFIAALQRSGKGPKSVQGYHCVWRCAPACLPKRACRSTPHYSVSCER